MPCLLRGPAGEPFCNAVEKDNAALRVCHDHGISNARQRDFQGSRLATQRVLDFLPVLRIGIEVDCTRADGLADALPHCLQIKQYARGRRSLVWRIRDAVCTERHDPTAPLERQRAPQSLFALRARAQVFLNHARREFREAMQLLAGERLGSETELLGEVPVRGLDRSVHRDEKHWIRKYVRFFEKFFDWHYREPPRPKAGKSYPVAFLESRLATGACAAKL